MKLYKLAIIAGILVMSPITGKLLAFPGTYAGEGEISECAKDYENFKKSGKCSATAHEETEIDCLLKNQQHLSAACKKKAQEKFDAWSAKDKSFKTLKSACSSEVKALKIEGKPQKAALVEFMMNRDKIGADCKKAVNNHIEKHLQGLKKLD